MKVDWETEIVLLDKKLHFIRVHATLLSSHVSLGKDGKFVIERGLKVREKTIKH